MTQGPEQVAEAMQQYETIDPSKIINEKDEVLNILQEYKKGGLTCSIKNDFFEFTKTDQNGQLETRYIRKERLDDLIRTDNAINDAGKDIEFLKNYISTKKALDNANKEVTGGNNKMTQYDTTQSESPKGNESSELYNKVDNANDQEELKSVIDEVIDMYKDLCKGVRGMEGNGKSVSEFRNWIKESIEELQKIRRDIKKHDYNNLSVYKGEVGKMIYYYDHYEQIRQLITIGETPDMFKNIHSKKDAEKALEDAERHMKSNKEMNELLHNTALISLWNDDMENFEKYLKAVINGNVEPATHPFYTRHRDSFLTIKNTDPTLYGNIVPHRNGNISYETYCSGHSGCQVCYNGKKTYRNGNNIGEDVATFIENRQKAHGKETNPNQREALRAVGNLVSIAGGIALGIGLIKELFPGKEARDKRKKDGKTGLRRGAIGGYAAGLYAVSNYKYVKDIIFDALNLDPDKYAARKQAERMGNQQGYGLVQDFPEMGYNSVNGNNGQINIAGLSQNESQEVIRKITYPTIVLSTLGDIKIKDLINEGILQEDNGKLVVNKGNYASYVEKMAIVLGWSDQEKQKMLNTISSESHLQAIGDGLAYCNIKSIDDLDKLADTENSTLKDSSKFSSKHKNSIESIKKATGIFTDIADQGFVVTGITAANKILETYDRDGDKNKQILERIMLGYLKVGPEENYSLDEMENNQDIDINNMTIKGLKNGSNEIKFNSYGDLFRVAHLTSWIKENFKGRTAVSNNPFHITTFGRIEFDNEKFWEIWENETSVLKSRTIKKVSETLGGNKQFYVDYLNERWKQDQENKMESQKIDLSSYPIVSNLGIDFFGENGKQEAHSLEIWMNEIKEGKKFSVPVENGQPFTVKWRFLNHLGNDLVFTAINGDKEVFNKNISKEFPTIVKDEINRKKFENYLNDPQNQMWGSAIN